MDQPTIVDLAEGIDPDLARRLDFLLEIDQLKSVIRRSLLVDGSRRENTAEHSWHLAMAALILARAAADKADREELEARRIFGLLPADQADHIDRLWREYEDRSTPTARFANAIDRVQPFLLNAASGGRSWQEHGIAHSQPATLNRPIEQVAPPLAQTVAAVLDACADEGLLVDDRPDGRASAPRRAA